MGTQAVVSVQCKQTDQVLMKIITGMDGQEASRLARQLRSRWPMSIEDVYRLALLMFDCPESLVVMTQERAIHDEDQGPLDARYLSTFDRPEFNPRWECGLADFTEIVRV